MADLQYSVAVRNAQLDAIETTIGTAPIMRLYEFVGAMPATTATARSGTLLCSMTLPTDWQAAAATGSKAKLGTWQAAATVAGTLHYWDIADSTGTTVHMQGPLARPHAVSTAYVLGQRVTNAGNVYRCTTAGTTGAATPPTVTTGTANDGTVVWTYESTNGGVVVPDAYAVANGQTVTVSTFAITRANA